MTNRATRGFQWAMRRVTYANVTATIALFVALGGAAFAAGIIDSSQIKNGSIRSIDVRNGTLTKADMRLSVRRKLNGVASLSDTIPRGTLVRGVYGASGVATAASQTVRSTPSFPAPVSPMTTSDIIGSGDLPTADCPGSVDSPQAVTPGTLCVYEYVNTNASVVLDAPGGAGSMGFGFVVQISSQAAGDYQSRGTWAYRAA